MKTNMKLLKTTGALGLVTLAAIASPLAMADESGWYGGANIGRSGANIDDERITSGLRGQGLATGSIADRDRDTAYKLYGGYRLNRNIAFHNTLVNSCQCYGLAGIWKQCESIWNYLIQRFVFIY